METSEEPNHKTNIIETNSSNIDPPSPGSRAVSFGQFPPPFLKKNSFYPLTRQILKKIKEGYSEDSSILDVKSNEIVFNEKDEVKVVSVCIDPSDVEKWKIDSNPDLLTTLSKCRSQKYKQNVGLITSQDILREQKKIAMEFSKRKAITGQARRIVQSKTCVEFLDPVETAEIYIENTIRQAKENLQKLVFQYGEIPKKVEVKKPLVQVNEPWTHINNFNVEQGLTLIEKYILNYGVFYEDWKYTIRFEGIQCDAVSDHYFYETNFSLPSRMYPVAQATASLFFHIEKSRVVPPICSVKVRFKVEGSQLVINPEKFILKERLLLRIIETKLKLFKELWF